MSKNLKDLESILSDKIYIRTNKEEVSSVLSKLNVKPSKDFIEFYSKYEGPFWEETLGLELMDIIEDNNNIFKATNICREEYGFENKYLVLTEMSVNEVVVLVTETNKVYRVNFEGGDELLRRGELNETWKDFNSFLKEYFGIND